MPVPLTAVAGHACGNSRHKPAHAVDGLLQPLPAAVQVDVHEVDVAHAADAAGCARSHHS